MLSEVIPTALPLFRNRKVFAYALVDSDDYERLAGHRWLVDAQGYVSRGGGRGPAFKLHREIMGLRKGDRREVDHRSRDKLDNRRINLRVCTKAENGQNRAANGNRGSSSRYRNVTWHKGGQKWMARAVLNRQEHYLGLFDDEDEAGQVAAAFRREHMPFAES